MIAELTRLPAPRGQRLRPAAGSPRGRIGIRAKVSRHQKARFAERLQFTVDVPTELSPAQVPQPDSSTYGRERGETWHCQAGAGWGAIRIAASRSNGTLTLRVYNDGPSLPPDWKRASRELGWPMCRLASKAVDGKAFQLSMCNRAPGGVETSISVPFVLPNRSIPANLRLTMSAHLSW